MTGGERAAYMLAAAALRRAAPWSPVPCVEHSRRAGHRWELADEGGAALASVSDTGAVVVHIGGEAYGVEVIEGGGDALPVVVHATVYTEVRWQCPACGTRWARGGRLRKHLKTCRGCGVLLWVQAPD